MTDSVPRSTSLRSGACDTQSTRFSSGQFWDINKGDGQVKLFGTNYCLDAGSNPANGVVLKVWTCYPGVPQQQWYYSQFGEFDSDGAG